MHLNWAEILSQPVPIGLVILGSASYLLWTIAYVLIIRQGLKDKTYGMPFGAMCFNIMWEFLYIFKFAPNGKGCAGFWMPLLNYALWFSLDLVIVGTWIKYWYADRPPGLSAKWHLPLLALGMMTTATLLIAIQKQYYTAPPSSSSYPMPNGGIAAFLMNLLMSVLFVDMVLRRNSAAGQSVPIALSKGVGTVLASIVFYCFFQAQDFYWVSLFVLCFLYDSLYVVLLLRVVRRPLTAQA